MYVCVCKGVTFSDAVEAAKTRGASPEALMKTFGFDDGDACGRCADHIAKISVLVRLVMDKSKRDLAVA